MLAYKTIQPLNNLHIEIDLPPDFSGYEKAEIIVLPVEPQTPVSKTWEERVMALAGILGDDFPDDIDNSDLGEDSRRQVF